jgi:cephalosporin hydroxylase
MHLGMHSKTVKGLRRVAALWSASSELDRIIATHTGHVVNKWKHYFEIYDRHLSRFRDHDITLVEIGVAGGGSLEIWRKYLGPKARIVGIDINPGCKRFESPGTEVFIGSQGDPVFLERVAAETGPFDIVIDDGSHTYEHQLVTFRALFPHIKEDGVYACEDLCTSYWKDEYDGGVRKPGTFVEFLKELIDETNAWFWRKDEEIEKNAFARSMHGLHFYPALAVIEKRPMQMPLITPVGRTRRAA